mmetsp:Transcript_106441/g.301022  ORF Transcript_106441/g.301022 Transcript_106441/m.301022 type:complete len:80 (+) Transcript_106441:1120-1359(+)
MGFENIVHKSNLRFTRLTMMCSPLAHGGGDPRVLLRKECGHVVAWQLMKLGCIRSRSGILQKPDSLTPGLPATPGRCCC